MRRWIPLVLVPFVLSLPSPSHALAPGDLERGFREGANHHVGDDSFAALYGRLPGPTDTEQLRMHAHFTHVQRWLSTREPTKPELAARRQTILGHFGDYIAKGTTPHNAHVPWRTPVFIDDHGTICAVGYLIEQTAGRPLAEQIARQHRYSLLEDIAADMPAVAEWIASSGLSMLELASIQPGYIPVMTFNAEDLSSEKVDSRPIEITGEARSSGMYTSHYPSGQRLAEGPFLAKKAQGVWQFYHPSGNLAARGTFDQGLRHGAWTFFHDSKIPVRKAYGAFEAGSLAEEWHHYDSTGKLVARSRPAASPMRGSGYLLDLVPRSAEGDNVHRWVHQATVAGTRHRLDFLADGSEQLYFYDREDVAYDAGGHRLRRVDGAWQESDCHFTRAARLAAKAGDVVTLHGLPLDPKSCDGARSISAKRAEHLEAMLASLHAGERVTPPELPHGAAESVVESLASFLARPIVEVDEPSRPALSQRLARAD